MDASEYGDLESLSLDALAPRERILKIASELFYRNSVHTVGIDRIIAESGVAKMTFYKHFPSKANLVATYLRHKSALWFDMLATATEQAGPVPLDRVLAVFDALNESFRAPTFRGCPFVRGLAEFGPDAETPEVQATLAAYFQDLHDFVVSLIHPLKLKNQGSVVVQILALIQGSLVNAQAMRGGVETLATRDAAKMLIEAAVERG
ncbi:Transcriptional regulator protein [Mesorhizobium metallidurans STM 2683]|uniref:Transcriptional regulator protein n=2 Tax=Mesorhizobium metallidurans TaxID=489722 RepID=M5EGS3_9HYPH|nr:Transcriptional regulator protein [Mesorhizobium metallidurans STM 2683]